MYHPLLVFDGRTNQLVTAVLRAANTHASSGALAVLKRIVGRLREAWPGVKIEIRADAGFAVPAVYEWCEREGVGYTIGLISNPRLETLAEPLLEKAQRESEELDGRKVRLVSEAPYRAESWERSRRVREAGRSGRVDKGLQAGAQGRPLELLPVLSISK